MYLLQNYQTLQSEIQSKIDAFHQSEGTVIQDDRNIIQTFTLSNGLEINIKSFKNPHFINKIAYKFFRKSKAKRSFEYAEILMKKNIGTPPPIGYIENFDAIGITDSYFISEQINYQLTYRELVQEPDYPHHEEILRAFTRFCFQLHEAEVEFLDHSPGNTLIQIDDEGKYNFFLVDLNRMRFRKLTLEQRMYNLRRLTPKKEMLEIMSDEYAQCIHAPKEKVFELLWKYTQDFQAKYHRRQRNKQKLKKLLGKS